MFLSTPFHTVLGLTVMQSKDLLGGDWYPSLRLTWADPCDDQQLAGGILWAGGEFVAVAMLGGAGRAVDARSPSGRPGGSTGSWTGEERQRPRRDGVPRAPAPPRGSATPGRHTGPTDEEQRDR